MFFVLLAKKRNPTAKMQPGKFYGVILRQTMLPFGPQYGRATPTGKLYILYSSKNFRPLQHHQIHPYANEWHTFRLL